MLLGEGLKFLVHQRDGASPEPSHPHTLLTQPETPLLSPQPMPHSLQALNQMDQVAFTAALGAVFEETPAVAATVWQQRPFASVDQLHAVMVTVVQGWDRDRQLALLKAHPQLGDRAPMAAASVAEQQSRGLTQLTTKAADRLQQLNRAYREKFGFPFIIAVKHHSRESIFAELERRLGNSDDQERQQALVEVAAIARLRLQAWVQEPGGVNP
jgi:2-oxo-4-hydroxy-4-carboxy-5-ureidoimidazoline decarboxylase